MVRNTVRKANKRIYATTDHQKVLLKVRETDANGWETFVVPDDIDGRFSVLTAVGLLPIAASGATSKPLWKVRMQLVKVHFR